MIYIDTDVLIHAYIVQDVEKHRQANDIIEQVNESDSATLSTLVVQEMLFVLERLRIDREAISAAYHEVMRLQPLAYDIEVFRRAVDIAKQVGFRNINDCIHTAIAESHCTELITYNERDFKKIREFTTIRVTIL